MHACFFKLILATVLAVGIHAARAQDILLADFEQTNYVWLPGGLWEVTGTAFGTGPAPGTLPGQMAVTGFQGHGLVNSFNGGDGSIGTLASPPFKLERKYLQFLIGGGGFANSTFMELLVDGNRVRVATGPNTQPGGSEKLDWQSWEVSEFAGRQAVLRIVDTATGGWGHINVDQIIQTDTKRPGELTDVRREFELKHRYLNLPIKNGAPARKVTLLVAGQVAVVNDMELADGAADWWAFMDVSPWQGKTVTLQVNKLPEDSTALSAIEPGDTLKGAENLYREPLRGQLHFSSRRGWNNDPNGLSFYQGEYHLFYQHNPYGWSWGNMHWGHAVSPDLVHWRELGDVLAPDHFGPMFSGSAVVDWQNTSGLGTPGHPPLVLIYTAAGDPSVQCLASSTDGRHFTKFSGNPVVNQISPGNRDPKVRWYEPQKKWIMCLYVGQNDVNTIQFLSSTNLRNWSVMSHIDGFFECPDFFELPVDGDASQKKWVLTAASSEYEVGSFDGTSFTPETPKLPGQRGRGCYAAQTFSDIPASDGRRIQIGWLQPATPGMPFNQCLSLPHELRLTRTPDGPRLSYTPVKELESLRAKSHGLGPLLLQPDSANPLAEVKSELVELRADFEPGAAETVFTVRGAVIRYQAQTQELVVNDLRVPAPLHDGQQRLIIYCDRTTLEIFASGGLTYVPIPFQPKTDDLDLGVQVKSGSVKFNSLQLYELKSAWE